MNLDFIITKLENALAKATELKELEFESETYKELKANLSFDIKAANEGLVQCSETQYCPDCSCNEEDPEPVIGGGGGTLP
ncbi:hypothetical protein [Seonamhaeicola sp.]|uniref:hypothetical protein n=1 Tax=Seonamhaeicola sp. TaxID=1912245 RepID=UPI0035688B96